jgi:hypothetical protein
MHTVITVLVYQVYFVSLAKIVIKRMPRLLIFMARKGCGCGFELLFVTLFQGLSHTIESTNLKIFQWHQNGKLIEERVAITIRGGIKRI